MKRILLILIILLFVGVVPSLYMMTCFAAGKNLTLGTEAKNTLSSLIDYYSKEDLDNFIANIDINFSDSRGYSLADLAAALKYDFRNFQNINLYITGVKEQIVSDDNSEITLVVEWNRSVVISATAQMWLSRGTTNLVFIKADTGKDFGYVLRLKEITGDLIFGLANYDGIITLYSGTLDGQQITVPLRLKEGRFQ
ncbi:MAG: hypothetical protein AB1755_01655 [Candidatus Omnitrophota bacterium]